LLGESGRIIITATFGAVCSKHYCRPIGFRTTSGSFAKIVMIARFRFLRAALIANLMLAAASLIAQKKYSPPQSPRHEYNFDLGWKFFKEDKGKVDGAAAVDFDDSAWESVGTPHTFNDVDSFRTIISHSGGDRGVWKGTAWYRKHFKLPAEAPRTKVLLEFEGFRQAAEIFLNGKAVGLSENGITAYGVDVTNALMPGNEENVLAVHVDNRTDYAERATGTRFEWNVNDFNPVYGGINRHVRLHCLSSIYQTLPLYEGLQTTGTYVYPADFAISDHSAKIVVESQVHNASADRANVELSAVIVDREGIARAKFASDSVDMVSGEKSVIEASDTLRDARFWSTEDPYLYDVYTTLTVDGKVTDVNKVTTGFRKTEFKGGAGTGGVYLNDQFVYLKGFAQRTSNEWAGLGQAYPDWMHDFTAQLIRGCNGNYIRWMHVAPQKVDAQSCDRFGIVDVAPAGDKERAVQGRQWEQRLEVMRATMISLRNHPSILFWEAGNTGIPAAQLQQMIDLEKQWDPHGGRVMGCRTLEDPATTAVAEYFGVMIGQDPRTDALKSPTQIFRAYSAQRRDRAPLIETEDFRDEGARRFWDDASPPYFGFKPGPNDTYHWNSETFALAAANRYWSYWTNRISNPDPAHSKWSGYASIYFSDSNADGRQQSSEVARTSGKVDAVRLPKEIYLATRVMQNAKPDIHILGHWTYPAQTRKTVYVVANCQAVELFVNGKSLQKVATPIDGYVFAFPDVKWEAGTLQALGYDNEREVCRQELSTAGPAKRIRLTPIVGPAGWRADGQDIALVDVEVVDDHNHRCPTDDARIDFTITGPAKWRGGYNSGKTNSTNNLYLNTECGINRVAVRSTLEAGMVEISAIRDGLEPAKLQIESKPVEFHDGLATDVPARLTATAK
jgi:beta-galactosidase